MGFPDIVKILLSLLGILMGLLGILIGLLGMFNGFARYVCWVCFIG